MNLHAALEDLIDRWLQWRNLRFRKALRRHNRRNRTLYVGSKPDAKCIVHNEPKI